MPGQHRCGSVPLPSGERGAGQGQDGRHCVPDIVAVALVSARVARRAVRLRRGWRADGRIAAGGWVRARIVAAWVASTGRIGTCGFCVVCLVDHGGNWDALDAAIQKADRSDGEAKWSRQLDLTKRLRLAGLTAAELAGASPMIARYAQKPGRR